MKSDNKSKITTITLNIDLNAALTGFGTALRATPAHYRILKHYASPLLLGPPPSDDLLEIIMHLFTEDEADLVQHLPPLIPRSAKKIARLSGRSVSNVTQVLDSLSFTKMVILAAGTPRKYAILPIVPGTFEMALMTTDISTRNAWHKRFAELFERLWEKGFLLTEYLRTSRAPIRYLPVSGISKSLTMAWPSDRLEEILDYYDLFAVGICQCRLAMQLAGKGCNRPLENCVAMGSGSKVFIERGMMRKAERQEIIEIKQYAEAQGCVTWIMNEYGTKEGNGSCSCCGCCCHTLRTITEFNAPGLLSKPHFMPVRNIEKCEFCKKCVKTCPMGTWTVSGNEIAFNSIRCIGCGLCVLSCESGALELKPVPNAKPPESNWIKLILKMTPGYAANTVRVWAKRLFHEGLS